MRSQVSLRQQVLPIALLASPRDRDTSRVGAKLDQLVDRTIDSMTKTGTRLRSVVDSDVCPDHSGKDRRRSATTSSASDFSTRCYASIPRDHRAHDGPFLLERLIACPVPRLRRERL